jgi:hypothetical protein
MKRFKIKRRHTEKHPAVFVSKNGKIRNAIISFIGECGGECSVDEYFGFLEKLKVDLELSYTPKYWHHRFKKYVVEVNGSETKKIRLTRLGNNFYNIVIYGSPK